MKKNVLTLVALAALTFTACKKENKADQAEQTTETVETSAVSENAVKLNVATADSKIEWVGGKVTGSSHNGTIDLKEGELTIDNQQVVGGNFVIDMNTISSTDLTNPDEKAGLEGHLKGSKDENADDFFNVNKYPTSTFELTSVIEEDGKQVVVGNLTIKDKTNEVKFPATVTVSETEVTIASEEFEIDRTLWGVNFNSGSVVKDLVKDKVINDNIKIKVSVKAVK